MPGRAGAWVLERKQRNTARYRPASSRPALPTERQNTVTRSHKKVQTQAHRGRDRGTRFHEMQAHTRMSFHQWTGTDSQAKLARVLTRTRMQNIHKRILTHHISKVSCSVSTPHWPPAYQIPHLTLSLCLFLSTTISYCSTHRAEGHVSYYCGCALQLHVYLSLPV